VDDPCGGFLDGARDRFGLPGLARWGTRVRRWRAGAHLRT
jgi:hypothetical protein